MIKFKYGTQSQYDNLSTKVNDTIYFITDTQKVYLGNNKVVPDDEIYWAKCGIDTYDDVLEKWDSGIMVICRYLNDIYILNVASGGNILKFEQVSNSLIASDNYYQSTLSQKVLLLYPNNSWVIGAEAVYNTPKRLVKAVYNITSYEEVFNALNNDTIVWLEYNNQLFFVDKKSYSSGDLIYFYPIKETANTATVGNCIQTYLVKQYCTLDYQAGWNYVTSNQVISEVQNDVITTSASKSLSANMGKALQDQIDQLKSIGKFLSNWNCLTGLPTTDPETMPYTYNTGDYYLVGYAGVKESISITQTVGTSDLDLTVDLATFKQALQPDENMQVTLEYDGTDWYEAGELVVEPEDYGISIIGVPEQDDTIEVYYTYPITSYKPTGSVYDGTVSAVIETQEVKVGDMYIYDGIEWILQLNHEKVIPVDTRLDPTSENAVQNRVIYKELTDDEFVTAQALNTLNNNVQNLLQRIGVIENLLNLGV